MPPKKSQVSAGNGPLFISRYRGDGVAGASDAARRSFFGGNVGYPGGGRRGCAAGFRSQVRTVRVRRRMVGWKEENTPRRAAAPRGVQEGLQESIMVDRVARCKVGLAARADCRQRAVLGAGATHCRKQTIGRDPLRLQGRVGARRERAAAGVRGGVGTQADGTRGGGGRRGGCCGDRRRCWRGGRTRHARGWKLGRGPEVRGYAARTTRRKPERTLHEQAKRPSRAARGRGSAGRGCGGESERDGGASSGRLSARLVMPLQVTASSHVASERRLETLSRSGAYEHGGELLWTQGQGAA
jgi:hypothetical protein